MAVIDPFGLPPEQAIQWFRQKGYALNFDWRDMWAEQHRQAFTVAKATQLDVLADLRQAVDEALAKGLTRQQFTKALRPTLQQKGWWGEKEEIDPLTGEPKLVQLGSANRLRTIYETNLRQEQAAARWERIERTAQARPWLRYVAVLDGNERAEHRRWHGIILPWDDPWWDTHSPPNGWGCRCKVMQLSDRDLQRFGLRPALKAPPVRYETFVNERTGRAVRVPQGIDPSFEYNPGKVRRAFTPPRSAPVLKPVRSFADYGRPRATEARATRPAAPALWPAEKTRADRERTDALFREAFRIPPGRDEAKVRDVNGELVTVSMKALEHARVSERARGEYTALVRSTLEDPYEVWMVPHRLPDGRVVMRKRYIGLFNDADELVVVTRGDDGYVSWETRKPGELDAQREGYLLRSNG